MYICLYGYSFDVKFIMDISEKLKPFINDLIKFYYEENPTGGHLHIVLDDGNIEDGAIYDCQEECLENKDYLGYLIAIILRQFSEDELIEMYQKDKWGMKTLNKENYE